MKPANYTLLATSSPTPWARRPEGDGQGLWVAEEGAAAAEASAAAAPGQAGAGSRSEGGADRARLTFCAALCCSTFCSTVMAPAEPAATQAAASGSPRPRRVWLPRCAELRRAARTAGEGSAPASQARRRWRPACAGTAGRRQGADGEGRGGDLTTKCGPPRPGPGAGGGRWSAGGAS